MKFNLLNRSISSTSKPFIIAEMSGNHNGSLSRAIEMVELAAYAKVDAIKLQTFKPESITMNLKTKKFTIQNKDSLWYGKTLYDLYKIAYTPWEWHKPIFKKADELGLKYFSTPFDEKAVDFLESLNTPFYKIASFENIHIPLIRKVAKTNKPIIISTGLASISEIHDALETIKAAGKNQYALLKCTSQYPANPKDSNILTIPHMKKLFDCEIGLSDHTLGIGAAIAAVAHGASIIEKHFTIKRKDGGLDSAFSLEPDELKNLVIECTRANKSLGSIKYGLSVSEHSSKIFRRSIFVTNDIKKNQKFNKSNIRCIRPGYGISPKYFDIIIGKKAKKDIKKGTPINWDLIS